MFALPLFIAHLETVLQNQVFLAADEIFNQGVGRFAEEEEGIAFFFPISYKRGQTWDRIRLDAAIDVIDIELSVGGGAPILWVWLQR